MNSSLTTMLRHMSPADFAALGAREMAYVKPFEGDEGQGFAIHAADGSPLAVVESRELAIAVCVQNDLEAASLH